MIHALALASFAGGMLCGALLTCLVLWAKFTRSLAEYRDELDRIHGKREKGRWRPREQDLLN